MQNNITAHYTIGFNSDERAELLELFKDNPKWKKRVEDGFGFLVNNNIYNGQFISPGFQSWMEKLPDKLHIGRKVKVIKGSNMGREGVVTDHWQNLDDCSGGYGNHLYQLEGDLEKYGCKNNSCAINAKDCELLD